MASFAQVAEISSISEKSFEDAIQLGIAQATQSLQGVENAWVKEQAVQIKNGKVSGYKVHLMITYGLEAE